MVTEPSTLKSALPCAQLFAELPDVWLQNHPL
jgi:hypothetical protein